jgi:hypothetical protein
MLNTFHCYSRFSAVYNMISNIIPSHYFDFKKCQLGCNFIDSANFLTARGQPNAKIAEIPRWEHGLA